MSQLDRIEIMLALLLRHLGVTDVEQVIEETSKANEYRLSVMRLRKAQDRGESPTRRPSPPPPKPLNVIGPDIGGRGVR